MGNESSPNPALVLSDAPPVLSLQGIELGIDTPSDLHRSGNSVYTCLARSAFSMGC